MTIRKLQVNTELLVALVTTLSIGLTGCAKKSDCDLKELHLHRYEKDGIIRYLSREELEYQGYEWTDDILYMNYGEETLWNFEQKEGLIKIADNEEYLQEQQSNNHDYIEYRYSYDYLLPISHTMTVGDTTTTYFTYIPMTDYSWTTNPEHSQLTGETRLCHHVYTAYKIVKNEEGNYIAIESPQVDDILSIKDEYPYFKENYTTIIKRDEAKEYMKK